MSDMFPEIESPTLCPCGCKGEVPAGKTFAKRGCGNRARSLKTENRPAVQEVNWLDRALDALDRLPVEVLEEVVGVARGRREQRQREQELVALVSGGR